MFAHQGLDASLPALTGSCTMPHRARTRARSADPTPVD
jgi:hypothetical protein